MEDVMRAIYLLVLPASMLLISCSSTQSSQRETVRRILKMQDQIGKKNKKIASLEAKNKRLNHKLNKKRISKKTTAQKSGEQRLYNLFVRQYRKANMKSAERALRLLKKAYPKSSKISEAHYLIAKEETRRGNYKKAIYYYNSIIKLHPRSKVWGVANLEKAKLYQSMNLKDPATKVLKNLIHKRPRSKEAKLAKRYLKANTFR